MRIIDHTREFLFMIGSQLPKNLDAIGLLLRDTMVESMRGKSPPPAAPGEPPHVATSTLRRSITYEVDALKLTVRIGTNIVYGKHLELGTHKMKARPFIRPAFEKRRKQIELMFRLKK